MNRIEAINAMLDGKVVVHGTYPEIKFDAQRNRFVCGGGEHWEEVINILNYDEGYAMIDGKKYKLVEEL